MKNILASQYASILGTRIVLVPGHEDNHDLKIILEKDVDPKTFVKRCWRHKLPIIVKNRSLYCSKEFPFDKKKSFLDALQEKYGSPSPLLSSLDLDNGKQIEFCGFQDIKRLQADFQRLKIVILENSQISSVDDGVQIGSILPEIQKLDLSSNLFSSMNDVLLLCSQLSKLSELILDKNKYLSLSDLTHTFTIRQVSRLFLRDCNIESKELSRIQNIFPFLKEFHLDYNEIKLKQSTCFKSIEVISLSNNNELLAADLSYSSVFERTKWLNISFCNISDLKVLPLEKMQDLSFLDISGNDISSWDQINLLQKLKNLRELRVSLSKLHDKTDESRMFVIARLPTLMKLNDVFISKNEREDSEIYFSSFIRKYISQKEISSAGVLDKLEPVWRHIWKRHGLSEPEFYQHRTIEKKPGIIKDNITQPVRVTYNEGRESLYFQFHQNWTVLSVKALIASQLNLRVHETEYRFKGQQNEQFQASDYSHDEKQLFELLFTITEVEVKESKKTVSATNE
ncbi:tubulin specific chaperone cofactor E [Schizosaccharomyces octosporus yFS286]|uniref:Tubulin specific chaperone cofactor E n=1 Tax=Schizosaccharomyces octosporus (strain yFS286) TaxID=483514 RepID=S9QWM0_SCHOY|nr:tubulin specific chaperone cofactor E [Schizosaccharomyces octosporus yFS286]EPX70700.1 tubulin specific chaperone cofactor E [Schizosaccharomyces octosporus yFS286]